MTENAVLNPTPEEATDLITAALEARQVVIIVGECDVEYEGRANGYLGPGDRVVLTKPDGTLLVHRPRGNDPVNWQPPGSTISADVNEEGAVQITARRSSPDELLHVYFKSIDHVVCSACDDTAPLELSGTEADMHEYIRENPAVIEDGLRILEHERATPYGSLDFFANDSDGTPVVIEVKRRQASLKHVDQLTRYVDLFRESNPDVRGVLVAPTASDRVERTLRDKGLEFIALDAFATNRESLSSTTLDEYST